MNTKNNKMELPGIGEPSVKEIKRVNGVMYVVLSSPYLPELEVKLSEYLLRNFNWIVKGNGALFEKLVINNAGYIAEEIESGVYDNMITEQYNLTLESVIENIDALALVPDNTSSLSELQEKYRRLLNHFGSYQNPYTAGMYLNFPTIRSMMEYYSKAFINCL
jgi:hypothetical protein